MNEIKNWIDGFNHKVNTAKERTRKLATNRTEAKGEKIENTERK